MYNMYKENQCRQKGKEKEKKRKRKRKRKHVRCVNFSLK